MTIERIGVSAIAAGGAYGGKGVQLFGPRIVRLHRKPVTQALFYRKLKTVLIGDLVKRKWTFRESSVFSNRFTNAAEVLRERIGNSEATKRILEVHGPHTDDGSKRRNTHDVLKRDRVGNRVIDSGAPADAG